MSLNLFSPLSFRSHVSKLVLLLGALLVAAVGGCVPEGDGASRTDTSSTSGSDTASTSGTDTTSGSGDGTSGGDTSGGGGPDQDDDGVPDDTDPAPTDNTLCGDSDADTCDDCSVKGTQDPANDGYDPDDDGTCELPLDYDCMNGANAAQDPLRTEACATMTMINNDRLFFSEESGGARPVRWNEDIWVVAIGHSKDMCDRAFFDHVNPDGEDPSDRGARAGLSFGLAENIAVNLDAGGAQYAFMAEPTCVGHRSNILNPGATEVGVGYYRCHNPSNQWDGYDHVTHNFRANSFDPSLFCQNPQKHCEVPPNPPTTAVCRGQAIDFGFCDPVDERVVQDPQWECVDD